MPTRGKEASTERQRSAVAKIASTLPRVVSSEVADLAQALRSQGGEVLTLYGAPFWHPPEHVIEAAERAARENVNPPSKGFLELREAISRKLEDEGVEADPNTQILVTHGAMHALSLVFTTLLDPGDEVLMYRPSFFFFGPIQLAGGVPVYANTREDRGWRWDAKALESAVSPRTKLLVMSSPTNPTGYVADRDDLLAVAEIARKYDLVVVSDESYDNMIYGERRHIRVGSLREIRDRTITICSFTKSFAMQPWRVGFIVAPPELAPHLQKVLEWNVLRCSHVAQRAAQAALTGNQAWISEIARRFKAYRDLMVGGLESARGISFVLPMGAPFLFLNVGQTGLSGADFSSWLLTEYAVPTDPGAFFGSDSHVRLLFGGPDEEIREAAKRISAASQSRLQVLLQKS